MFHELRQPSAVHQEACATQTNAILMSMLTRPVKRRTGLRLSTYGTIPGQPGKAHCGADHLHHRHARSEARWVAEFTGTIISRGLGTDRPGVIQGLQSASCRVQSVLDAMQSNQTFSTYLLASAARMLSDELRPVKNWNRTHAPHGKDTAQSKRNRPPTARIPWP